MSACQPTLDPPVMVGSSAFRALMIAALAFLTLVDLFATQAILPSLAHHYGASPASASLAVNASTLGMAVASLAVAFLASKISRRAGVVAALLLLAPTTALLALAPNLEIFAALRVIQGLFMASAFALTLAYLGEHFSASAAAGVFAAYVTGNVASNLIGRFTAAFFVDHYGLSTNFLAFSALNLAGAALAAVIIEPAAPMAMTASPMRQSVSAWRRQFQTPGLAVAFAVGFCILFAFVGTFSFVNFVLQRPPLSLGMMQVGFVYLVFAPSIVTTALGGAAAARWGHRRAAQVGLALAIVGVLLAAIPNLGTVMGGLALVGVGTFLAQAVVTGYVARAARSDRGTASGLYLASYFSGGLIGSAMLGAVFEAFRWNGCVAGITLALLAAIGLASRFVPLSHAS